MRLYNSYVDSLIVTKIQKNRGGKRKNLCDYAKMIIWESGTVLCIFTRIWRRRPHRGACIGNMKRRTARCSSLPLAVLYYKLDDLKTAAGYLKRLFQVNPECKIFALQDVEPEKIEEVINASMDKLAETGGYKPGSLEEFLVISRKNSTCMSPKRGFWIWAMQTALLSGKRRIFRRLRGRRQTVHRLFFDIAMRLGFTHAKLVDSIGGESTAEPVGAVMHGNHTFNDFSPVIRRPSLEMTAEIVRPERES